MRWRYRSAMSELSRVMDGAPHMDPSVCLHVRRVPLPTPSPLVYEMCEDCCRVLRLTPEDGYALENDHNGRSVVNAYTIALSRERVASGIAGRALRQVLGYYTPVQIWNA